MDDDAPPWRRKTAATLKPQATTIPVRHVPPPEQKAKHEPPPAQKAKQPQAPQAPLSSDKYREVRLFFQRQTAEAEKAQKLLDTERARLEKGEIFPVDMEAAWSQPAWELARDEVPDIRQTMRKSTILHTSYLCDLPVLIESFDDIS
jgi:hypothetical protein